MKLTKKIKIAKYRVLAEYKVKEKNSPFLAILKLTEENDGWINSKVLYEDLLQPLPIKACANLLIRMKSLGYFKDAIEHIDCYELTDFGKKSLKKKEFYNSKHGILELWIAESNEFTDKIVKIEELRYDEDQKSEIKNITDEIKKLVDNEKLITVDNISITLDKVEEQIKYLKSPKYSENLTITFSKNNAKIKLVNFSGSISIEKEEVKKTILRNRYESDYLANLETVLVDYDDKNPAFKRDLKISEPKFENTLFDTVTIPNHKVAPKNEEEASKWYLDLLENGITKYFCSEEEYENWEEAIFKEFEPFSDKIIKRFSKQELIKLVDRDFYKKAKLETIDYLNY